MLPAEQVIKNFRSNFLATTIHYDAIINNIYPRERKCDLDKIQDYGENHNAETIKNLILQLDILIREPLINNVDNFKSFLSGSGYQIHKDFFNNLTEEHVIEVYSLDHFQQYRSLNFFKYIKYNALELYAYKWETLYSRPSFVLNMINNCVIKAVTEVGKVHNVEIPRHVIKHNLIKLESKACHLDIDFMTACYNENNEINGVAVASKAELIDYHENDFNFI